MDYKKNYNDYIMYVKSLNRSGGAEYYELHHIIPRCLGGINDKTNLVLLTSREHFLAHYLLCKINQNESNTIKAKLSRAFSMMNKKGTNQESRYINSRLYAKLKENFMITPVICLETKEIFPTVASAANHYKCSRAIIHACCKGEQFTAAKKHWAFYEEEKEYNFEKHIHAFSKKIICINTGEIYNSITEASNKINCNHSSISKCVIYYDDNKYCSYKGLQYAFYIEGKKYKLIEKCGKRNMDCCKKVKCVETGIVYNSITEAEEKSGANQISNTLAGRQKTSGGFHWEFPRRYFSKV